MNEEGDKVVRVILTDWEACGDACSTFLLSRSEVYYRFTPSVDDPRNIAETNPINTISHLRDILRPKHTDCSPSAVRLPQFGIVNLFSRQDDIAASYS